MYLYLLHSSLCLVIYLLVKYVFQFCRFRLAFSYSFTMLSVNQCIVLIIMVSRVADRKAGRYTGRQGNRETGRQAGRQTGRQAGWLKDIKRPVAPARGGAVAPNVEKDGPRNSSKFDEKIGRGCVSISDVKNHKY